MKRPENIWLLPMFAAILAVYFCTEALLRQATVSRINPDAIRMDEIIQNLPGKMQDRIRNRMILAQLQTNLKKAETDVEKVNAMHALAGFTQNPEECRALHKQILDSFPSVPASYLSYVFFMFNSSPADNLVSMEQFHEFQRSLPLADRFYAWVAAYEKFKRQKDIPNARRLVFLLPLNEFKEPPFYEYQPLFDALRAVALAEGRNDVAERAAQLSDRATYKRSFSEYMMQMEEDGHYRNEMQNRKTR